MARYAKVVSFDVGSRNCALCAVQSDPAQVVIWEVIDIVAERDLPQRCSCERLVRALIECLCARREALMAFVDDRTSVVVEQQPLSRGRGSPTMSALSHAICTWFLCQHPRGAPAYAVGLIHAKAKLQLDTAPWGAEPAALRARAETAPRRTAVWHGTARDEAPVRDACADLVSTGKAHYAAVYADADGEVHCRVVFKAPRGAPSAVAAALACVGVAPQYGATAARQAGQDLPAGAGRFGTRPAAPTARRKRRRAEYEAYRENKGYGVRAVRALLDRVGATDEQRSMFESSAKKDDLSDALLQGLTQLRPPPAVG